MVLAVFVADGARVADGVGDADEAGDDAGPEVPEEATRWPVTRCPDGIRAAPTRTRVREPNGAGSAGSFGAACPLTPPAPLARVANAGT